MRLKNKTVIVTGGASGIGCAIAIGMAKEGARIIIADIDLAGAQAVTGKIQVAGGTALAVRTDVAEKNQVDAMVSQVKEKYGSIDILVCCAAVKQYAPLDEVTIEQWDRVMAVNVRGVFLAVQAVAAVMVEKKTRGRIIVMNSLAAYRGRRHQQAYCASKAALLAFVGNAALQLGKYGINVNGLAPGVMDMKQAERMKDRDYKVDHIPAKRMGRPEDLVGPAIFLATEDSAYISGETIKVDGAFSQRVSGCDI